MIFKSFVSASCFCPDSRYHAKEPLQGKEGGKTEKKEQTGEKKESGIEKKKSEETREDTREKRKPLSSIQYNLRRNKKMLRFFSLLPFAAIFLLILLASTIQNSFEREYMRSVKENFPVDAFNLYREQLETFPYKDKIGVYEYYTATEADVTAYYLAENAISCNDLIYMVMPTPQSITRTPNVKRGYDRT